MKQALDNIEKASFVLGCELWTDNFDALLALVKEYIIDLIEPYLGCAMGHMTRKCYDCVVYGREVWNMFAVVKLT